MLFIPDFEEVRNEFQIKNTEKYRKQSQAKLIIHGPIKRIYT